MRTITKEFLSYASKGVKDGIKIYALIGERQTLNELQKKDEAKKLDELIKVTLNMDGGIASSAMASIQMEYFGCLNIIDKFVYVYYSSSTNDSIEDILLGTFKITEESYNEENKTSTVKGFDDMLHFSVPVKEEIKEVNTVYDFVNEISQRFGIELDSSFEVTKEFTVGIDKYHDSGLVYRDILDDISELYNGTIFIRDGKLVLKRLSDPVLTLGESELIKYKVQSLFGPINSLVLNRAPQEDNIYSQIILDDEKVEEIKLSDNLIVDHQRQAVVDKMFKYYNRFQFTPFEVETIGYGIFEPLDCLQFKVGSEIIKTYVTSYTLILDGGIHEVLRGEIDRKATKYEYATDSQKRLHNTELIVDKQKREILSLVQESQAHDEKLTQLKQSMEGFEFKVQSSGGLNLLKNSSGWNEFQFWEKSENSKIEIFADKNIRDNTATKNSFSFIDGQITQEIEVQKQIQHTLSFKLCLKLGKIKIAIKDGNVEKILLETNHTQEKEIWKQYAFTINNEFTNLVLIIEGSGEVFVSDIMLSEGSLVTKWQPHIGEIYSQNVRIDEMGIEISNSKSKTKTIINEYEFSVNNQSGKTISVNDTLTTLQETKINKQLTIGLTRFETHSEGLSIVVLDKEVK